MSLHPRFSLFAATLAAMLPCPLVAQELASAAEPHDHERARTLDELVVTATPLRSGSDDVAQPVAVLAGEELDAQKAATLGETVANTPGVQSSFFGAGVGRPIIRGQDGARVQVLSGGTSSLDASTVSVDHAVSIEPFLAEQIEILKGPAALLYGSGAIGGAVNVVDGRVPTRVPDAPTGRAELRGDTGADERTGMFRLDAGAGAFAWHADAFSRDADDYDIPGFAEREGLHEEEGGEEHEGEHEVGAFGFLPNSAFETQGGSLGASWVSSAGFLGAALSTYRSDYGIPGHHHHHDGEGGEEGEEEHEEEAVRVDLEQTRFDVRGEWTAPTEALDALRVNLVRNDYRHQELEGGEPATRFDSDGSEARVELVHAPLAGWHGALGLQHGRRDFAAIGEEAFLPPSLTRDLGLFLLEERDFGRVTLQAGARHEQVEIDPEAAADRDFDAASASLGLRFDVNEAVHLNFGLDRAERAPTAEELFSDGAHVATQAYEVGDSTLGTEVANQLEAGLHLHLGRLSGHLSVYETRYDDFLFLLDTGEEIDALPVRQWQQADATFRGLEAEATLRLAENSGGAWDLRLLGDRVRASFDGGGALPRIAPARLGATLAWERDGWRASLGALRYGEQDRVAEGETTTPGYTLVDAHLAYHWDSERVGWEVFLDGRNLTDREARVHTSFLKDIAPLPGRSVAFGVRVFF